MDSDRVKGGGDLLTGSFRDGDAVGRGQGDASLNLMETDTILCPQRVENG